MSSPREPVPPCSKPRNGTVLGGPGREDAHSDSHPRLLPVSRRVLHRGRDLERMLNLWRIGVAASLLILMAVAAGVYGFGRFDLQWAIQVLLFYLIVALGFQLFLAWFSWHERIPLITVVFDLTTVTVYLFGLVVADQAIVAVNSQIGFLCYFLIVVWAGVRSNARLAQLMAWGAPLAYGAVLFLAIVWRDVAFSPSHPVFGGFRWESQASRLLMLGGISWLIRFAVNLEVTDRDQAARDPLTGLFNRRYLLDQLQRGIVRAIRRQQPFSVLLLDLDGFKAFNDTHGHLQGDIVLAEVAAALAQSVRSGDLVGRFGGDEFVVVLPATPGEVARRVAWELTRVMPHGIGLSVGVACVGEQAHSVDLLLQAADQALFEAKQAGGGVVVAK